jgi:hypothetical protein
MIQDRLDPLDLALLELLVGPDAQPVQDTPRVERLAGLGLVRRQGGLWELTEAGFAAVTRSREIGGPPKLR